MALISSCNDFFVAGLVVVVVVVVVAGVVVGVMVVVVVVVVVGVVVVVVVEASGTSEAWLSVPSVDEGGVSGSLCGADRAVPAAALRTIAIYTAVVECRRFGLRTRLGWLSYSKSKACFSKILESQGIF